MNAPSQPPSPQQAPAAPALPWRSDPEFYRPQTYLLLAAVVLLALALLLPLYVVFPASAGAAASTPGTAAPGQIREGFTVWETLATDGRGMFNVNPAWSWPVLFIHVSAIVMTLWAVTWFRRRARQRRVATIAAANVLTAAMFEAWTGYWMKSQFADNYPGTDVNVGFMAWATMVAALLVLMAVRFIRKDELTLARANRFW